jgi:hypothetical protein
LEDLATTSMVVSGLYESKLRRRERLRRPILPFEFMPIPERPEYVEGSEVIEFDLERG